jgi:ABC-type glycerol-3-phosphate transport system substrate-binding protein
MQRLDRQAFLSRGALLLAVPGALTAAGCRERTDRGLSPISANWVLNLHPAIEQVSTVYLPTRASGEPVDDFVREAEARTSTWDTYIGMTPWVEMARLAKDGVIEPWDEYLTDGMLRDVLPKIRAEATLDGHVYSWPFLLDIVVQAWNGELVERAGLDPTLAPASWDEYIAHARAVRDAGFAPYGCTFDPRGARTLVPIAHSLAADPYTDDGLFDFTHPASVEALHIMRRMFELASPDTLDPAPALASYTPDEVAFGDGTVAYSVKYQNAHVRVSSNWPDPTRLQIAALPANRGSVFWTVGLALLRYGKHKEKAAAYAEQLTHDERVWRMSLGTGLHPAGQLPPFRTRVPWTRAAPTWEMASWASAVAAAFPKARTIPPHPLGEKQFIVARRYWEQYLRDPKRSARRVLAEAMAAVRKAAPSA